MNMIPHAITSLLSMVFHTLQANAYLVSSVYENTWNTLQLLRSHFLAWNTLLKSIKFVYKLNSTNVRYCERF